MGSPFVGRQRELAMLDTSCSDALAGHRQLIVLRGEPGIGKTRFAEQAGASAERAGFAVVWGRCWPHGGAPPLWPWQPILAQLLGDDGAGLLAGDPGHDDVDPERFARFAAVADRLRQVIADRPLMLVLDDVHNADAGTLLLTRFITRTLDRSRLVMLLVRRSHEPAPGSAVAELLAELEVEATTLQLPMLDLRETIALLTAGGNEEVDPGTVATLLRVTGGSPLLLTRAIAHGSTSAPRAATGQAISDAIAALPSAVRHIVALAAVLGPSPTIAEVASLAGDPAEFVVDAIRVAEERGLMDLGRDDCTFQHDLIRDAALATLTAADRLDADARAACLLADDARTERVVRRAHHALAAAPRSEEDAAIAVDAAREAAQHMQRGFDYETAATLLAQAVAVSERLPPRAEWAGMHVELARAVQSCGRLAEARALFARAVDVASASGNTIELARAAIGLGGVWLNEHRDQLDHEHMLAVQRSARDALDDAEPLLRCRLAMRLAAEAVYDGGPVSAVHDVLAEARRLGDGATLAEALSLAHHALLAPGNGEPLLAMSDELMSVASASGEGTLALLGLMWRTVDLYQLDDQGAERSLAELRRRVDALGCRSIAYIVAAIDVMRLIRSGRLDEAEEAAGACVALGNEVGDADATGYYAAHLLTIRFMQARDTELLALVEEAAASPLVMARERGLRAALASIAARSGHPDRARAALDQVRVANIAPSSTSLAALMSLAETALALRDPALAREVYAALLPHAALPIMPSLAVTCLGSVERPLGLAATALGDRVAAQSHFERALRHNRRLGNRPMTAISQAELADALLASPAEQSVARRQRAAALYEHAAAAAEEMGMTARASAWRERAGRITVDGRVKPPCTLQRAGRRWVAQAGPLRAEVPDLVGMAYLKTLIDRPGEEISAAELCGSRLVDVTTHEMVDRRTLDEYRARVRELDAEIDEAEADADLARAERLRMDRELLRDELSQVLNVSGRARGFVNAAERARTAVHKAVKRAIDAIAQAEPELGAALRSQVTTGNVCRYQPAPMPVRAPAHAGS